MDSVDHRAFVLNGSDGTVAVVDLAGRRLLHIQRLPAPWPCAIATDARPRRIYVLSNCLGTNNSTQLLSILAARSGTILKTISISKTSTRVIFDGRAIIVNGLTDGSLNFFNPQSGALEAAVHVAGGSLAPLDISVDRAHHRAFVYLRDVSPRGTGQEMIATVDTVVRRVIGVQRISSFGGWCVDSSAGVLYVVQSGRTTMLDDRTNRIIRNVPVTGRELWGGAAQGNGVLRTRVSVGNELEIVSPTSARVRATAQVAYPRVIATCDNHAERCAVFSADAPIGFPHHILTVFSTRTGHTLATLRGTDNVSSVSAVAFDDPTHSLLAVSLDGPCTATGNRWVEIATELLGSLHVFGPSTPPSNQPGTLCIVNVPPHG